MRPVPRVSSVLAVLLLGVGSPLYSQSPRLGAQFLAGEMRVHTDLPGGTEDLRGMALGMAGTVAVGPVVAALHYREARLTSAVAGVLPRDVVEGGFALGGTLTRWLTVIAGPHVRAYDSPAGTQRWLFWELRARLEAPIVPDRVSGAVEGWPVLKGSVNLPDAWWRGGGGAVSLALLLPGLPLPFLRSVPLHLRVGYSVEVYQLRGRAQREVVDGLSAALSLGLTAIPGVS